jgi:hypothetical protein
VSLGIQDRTHPNELQISFELRGQIGLGKVEPIGSGGNLIL